MELDPVVVHRIFGALIAVFSGVLVFHEIDVVRGGWAACLPSVGLLLGGDEFVTEGNQHA